VKHFFQSIKGWFDFGDIYALMVQKAPAEAHFVEVGAFLGKSTSFMAVEINNSGKDIRFDVVDTWEGSLEHGQGGEHQMDVVLQGTLYENFKRNMKPVAHLINPVRCSSVEAARRYRDGSLDFVFLDASHEYEDVKADIVAWRPKIKPGGFLGGHDLQALFPGVIRAVQEEFPSIYRSGFSWLVRMPAVTK
jgi:predicted O-methyltransferase YrrM